MPLLDIGSCPPIRVVYNILLGILYIYRMLGPAYAATHSRKSIFQRVKSNALLLDVIVYSNGESRPATATTN